MSSFSLKSKTSKYINVGITNGFSGYNALAEALEFSLEGVPDPIKAIEALAVAAEIAVRQGSHDSFASKFKALLEFVTDNPNLSLGHEQVCFLFYKN